MVNVIVGEKAPDFTLLDSNMQPRSLHEFMGQKVVLTFFVGAFTATCTMEACSFRDAMDRLTDLDAQVIGVSVNDPNANREFQQKEKLFFPILSDDKLEVVKLYGLELPGDEAVEGFVAAKRAVFILDQEGIIRYMWASKNPSVEPDYSELQVELTKIA
ncbi:MAG: peroxiredoxin [Candidatus Bathyarchaeota archaeon]|nr:peroxiredoxin [Candidatus Bathyarchaeota archaeon]